MATYSPSKITKDGNTYNFTDTTKIPLSGTNALSGSIVPSTDNSYDFGDSSHNLKRVYAKEIRHGLNSGVLFLGGGNGANIELYGNKASSYAGWVSIKAVDDNRQYQMLLKPDGTFKWGSKNVAMQEDVIPRSGGSVMTGTTIARTVDDSNLILRGGTDDSESSSLTLFGKNSSSDKGKIRLIPRSTSAQMKDMWLTPNGTWTWTGTACQITSDQRYKQQITEIDDKLLDAWEDVDLVQFKYNDAVEQKGKDKARLHTGYVVQQINSACKEHGVDVSAYGLYCHEEYPQETEEVEVEQADGTKTKERKVIREANEHYSLRYTEALIVECAYLRKCVKELRNEIEELKSSK